MDEQIYQTKPNQTKPNWEVTFDQNKDATAVSILVLLESYLQTCMTYTIAECTVNKLLMMDRGTVRNT